ncbi:MAG TPA: TVP38/TMEM64 family protein, partial [Vicinamibacterales bacterium]|nr:TVP38/TMEM64 family protein [Vicinamibacterales bacterium]
MSRRLLAAALALAAAMLLVLHPRAADWTRDFVARLRVADDVAVVLYVAVYALATVVLLPGSIFTLAAGFAFGPVVGVAAAWSGAMAGAMLAFLLGRTVLGGWARRRLARTPRARALDRAIARESFKVVLLLRLSPVVPFNLLNYALSLAPVSFGRYAAATAVGMLPVTVLYVYAGSLAT